MSSTVFKPLVLITGANQGIGKAVAESLAGKHSYHVLLGVRNVEAGNAVAKEIQGHGHDAEVIQLDVSSQTSMEAAASQIEKKYGYLDVLINNAGVALDLKSLPRYEIWQKTFQTNAIGPGYLTELLLPLLKKAKAGPPRIVFVSSIMGSLTTTTDHTTMWYPTDYKTYDATKAALNMLMLNFDREMAEVGGKVNSVCPGYVATSMTGYTEYGTTTEVGAEHVVSLAIVGKDGPSGTFTNREGTLPW